MNKKAINYDHRSVIINNERRLLICGAVHYPRIMPSQWQDVIQKSKAGGLNCIETYVFWEGHEPQEGQYNFCGRYNLPHFLETCQSEGMYVILRIGPYICSEWNFGGLAWWLLTKKNLVTRTWNKPFMNAVEHWLSQLMAKVGRYQITRGGPVILIQMENEYKLVAKRYGREGKKYLKWIGEMAKAVGVEVPIIMCEGAAKGVIETLNDFSVWPLIDRHRRRTPDKPILWTENWPGWYDTWGNAHNTRKADEISYEVLRFFALGGSGVNYYMWHGGTNFGRDAMFLQTTSYDFDAPLDEYGLTTGKYEHLKKLHLALLKYQDILLEGRMVEKVISQPTEAKKGDGVYLCSWKNKSKKLLFLINGSLNSVTINTETVTIALPSHSGALFVQKGKNRIRKLFTTWELPPEISRKMVACKKMLLWRMRKEPLPYQLPQTGRKIVNLAIAEQMLSFTKDETDYAWYQTSVDIHARGTSQLTLSNASDRASLWINGIYIGTKPERLQENYRTSFKVEFSIPLRKGRNRITILISALGLIKGDWMINAPQSEEKKGLWGSVLLDGKKIKGIWTLEAGLQGERIHCFEQEVASKLKWKPISKQKTPLWWHRADFIASSGELSDPAPWAVCVEGLEKGFMWMNGFALGRYWQLSSKKELPGFGKGYIVPTGIGEPPQIYYHIPREIIKKNNMLVIFDEQGASPENVCLVRRR